MVATTRVPLRWSSRASPTFALGFRGGLGGQCVRPAVALAGADAGLLPGRGPYARRALPQLVALGAGAARPHLPGREHEPVRVSWMGAGAARARSPRVVHRSRGA